MSPHFVLGRENVPCVSEVVNRSLKADYTDFTINMNSQHNNYPVFSGIKLFSLVIDFFQTQAHLKFVYKLDIINNHKTALN